MHRRNILCVYYAEHEHIHSSKRLESDSLQGFSVRAPRLFGLSRRRSPEPFLCPACHLSVHQSCPSLSSFLAVDSVSSWPDCHPMDISNWIVSTTAAHRRNHLQRRESNLSDTLAIIDGHCLRYTVDLRCTYLDHYTRLFPARQIRASHGSHRRTHQSPVPCAATTENGSSYFHSGQRSSPTRFTVHELHSHVFCHHAAQVPFSNHFRLRLHFIDIRDAGSVSLHEVDQTGDH